ncbi:hypothetical protein BDN72DRAFT_23903 [Pluteus cervinus]|uniref:Uncharacterized protein n=1 Tax=Pluteus cervinus TaxID=181527 RepID=A0ACD3BG71_9AGAR|nr:hypothetical protein BDN72DRAFT_23903 [Pluteus cervinus]
MDRNIDSKHPEFAGRNVSSSQISGFRLRSRVRKISKRPRFPPRLRLQLPSTSRIVNQAKQISSAQLMEAVQTRLRVGKPREAALLLRASGHFFDARWRATVGRRLMRCLVTIGTKCRMQKIMLTALHGNARAMQGAMGLYRKLGRVACVKFDQTNSDI